MADVLSISGAASTAPQAASLRHACRDLEEVFLRRLVQEMTPKDSLSHSAGSFVTDSLAEGALSGALADSGGLGIADLLYRQLYPATVAGLPLAGAPVPK